MRGSQGSNRNHLLRLAFVTWALVLMSSFSVPAEDIETDGKAEWTVMMYFCGSDLESNHGMATYNLKEMAGIHPDLTRERFMSMVYEEDVDEAFSYDKVNVVIETGGCRQWHTLSGLGLDISSEKLQRWSFTPVEKDSGESPFTFVEDRPLQSMSDPETLADFIRWGAENYPARKYALVLWDHGGGATGIFIDELFEKDILYLDELEKALKDGGVRFEDVILDACLMANLETALAVAPQASYLVASEETTSGYGSAFGEWLWELYLNPGQNGRQLGMCVCDQTIRKYLEIGDDQINDLQTYAVLDLSRIEEMGKCFDEIFFRIGEAYEKYPDLLNYLDDMFRNADKFGGKKTPMIDIGGILDSEGAITLLPAELRARAQNALSNCVSYCVRGEGRAGSSGISFCNAINMPVDQIEIYARNCRSPHYLAYLDAISDWEAPDSLYEEVPELTEIRQNEIYQFDVENVEYDGFPAASIQLSQMTGVGDTNFYEWYKLDEETEQYVCLGRMECQSNYNEETQEIVLAAADPQNWPSIEGTLCSLQIVEFSETEDIFNIPIRMNDEIFNLRCGHRLPMMDEAGNIIADSGNKYEIYGIWNGYDADTGMPSRNVVTMSEYQGRDYRLLYPVSRDDWNEEGYYAESKDMTMYRRLYVTETVIPEGDYAIRYIVTDLHNRELPQEMQYLHWDGQTFTRK